MLPFLIVEIEVSKEITYQFINPRNVERFQKIYLVIQLYCTNLQNLHRCLKTTGEM